jgi:hypothetical protein
VRTLAVVLTVICGVRADAARAQSLTAEAAITAGGSSEDVGAAAVQVRGFGDIPGAVRYFAEATWGNRTSTNTDAFGAAYPYSDSVQVMEAYVERMFHPGRWLVGARAGRYRTPFGISSGSDYAYTGFLRAPLIRYDGYYALSNSFLEHGADVVVGVPQFTIEASIGRPGDAGTAVRRSGVDTVVRAQGFYGPFIVGVSHIETAPYLPATFAFGKNVFTGVDLRWMQSGIQLRGEWITGRPFNGTTTTGWYADAIVHPVILGPVTAVARAEQLDYDTIPPFDLHARRQTIGLRVRFLQELSAQLNLIHQSGPLPQKRPTALDVGVTYTLRHTFRRN